MQNVTLTHEEREVVLDYATRLEKRSRQWRVLRWLSVGCFIFGLGLVVAVEQMSARMHAALELPPEVLKIPEGMESKSVESKLQLLVAHRDAQVVALRAEMYLLLKALIAAGIGTALFVHAVSDWRRDRRGRLIVRLLRLVVTEVGNTKHES